MNTYYEILEKIKEYETITVFGHVSPDGDCYGAQSGLAMFIRETFPYKNVYIIGSGFKKAIPYFDEMDLVDDETIKSSLAIVVDVSQLERIEDQRITLAKEIIKFDHHIGSEEYGIADLNISNTSASSASQMIGEFILDNGYRISKNVGERIFLGMVTDSGRFLYLSSSTRTFFVAEEIMKAGIDFQKIYDFLYDSDEITTRAKGYIMYNFKASKNNVAYIVLSREILHRLNIDFNFGAVMVNSLSGMSNFPIWTIFSESDEGKVRVELRSKKYNVQEIALKFNGGGHQKAAGCVLNNIDDYYKVLEALDKVIEEDLCGKMN